MPGLVPCPLLWVGTLALVVYDGYTNKGTLMAKSKSTSSNKESRLSIRIDPSRKAVIARAAKQHAGGSLSDFVVENAYQLAMELLVDEGTVALSKKQVAHIF